MVSDDRARPGTIYVRSSNGMRFEVRVPDLRRNYTRAELYRLHEKEMKMKDEQEIEQQIQNKGLNAPRLTPQMIDDAIAGEAYHVFPGTTLTVCALTLRNGFIVTGESAAASPENFDEEIGRKIARDNARNKIWAFEGYRLKQQLFDGQAVKHVTA